MSCPALSVSSLHVSYAIFLAVLYIQHVRAQVCSFATRDFFPSRSGPAPMIQGLSIVSHSSRVHRDPHQAAKEIGQRCKPNRNPCQAHLISSALTSNLRHLSLQ